MRIRLLAIGLIAGILAGCSGSGGGSTPSPSPSSVSPTPTVTSSSPSRRPTGPLTTGPNVRPGEKPPTFPALAKQHTQLGALSFGAYYFKALDWSIATNDGSLIQAIAQQSCSACSRVEKYLEALHAAGDVLLGGRIHIQRFQVVTGTFRVKSDVTVRVVVTQDAERRKGPSSTPTPVASRARSTSLVFLNWTSSGWRVAEVAVP